LGAAAARRAGNPLAQVRLDKPVRPHPVIWTDERVEAWRRDGIRPPVAVWTLRQLVTFLTGVENDRLAALWWLIALRGLRRSDPRTRTGPGWRQGARCSPTPTGGRAGPSTSPTGFRALIRELDLPPIRLHDLRHGAATIALASRTDLKVIQQMLGHSSIVTTADTYTNSRELHLTGGLCPV
jgi:hypothetical protein